MIGGERFNSASGLRPASAFVLIAGVLLLVGARAAKIALIDEGEQPRNLTRLMSPPVTFDLVDARGVPMALSVECLELVMSPNAMWQAHTPDKMARELTLILGPAYSRERLLERMLPDAVQGVIRADAEPLLMNGEQARRVHDWIRTGSTDPDAAAVVIEGFWIHPTDRVGQFGLDWRPDRVLSEEMRLAHGVTRPLDWSRKLADDLIACLDGPDTHAGIEGEEERKARRKEIWDALMPSQFRSVIKEVPASDALEIFELLKLERVRGHQMELRRHAKRVYPVQGNVQDDPPVAVLGRWGTLDPDQARRRARVELRLPDDANCSEQELDLLRSKTSEKVFQPSPMSGLELLCERMLQDPSWNFLQRQREEYIFLANQVPRQPLQRYYKEVIPASQTPHVITTLDINLQRELRLWLERVDAEHHPAVAMAIALDVATGAVLAVDALDPYDMGGFLPTVHTFTPGSTMKAIVMATALDQDKVAPDTLFKTYDGNYHIESRVIREAEGALNGTISAAQGLAFSINAVLVQIGLRVPPETLRAYFIDLGYAQYPGAGLGGERPGMIPRLPWKPRNEHASVSFGHEMFVTLWQHAAGLATIVRGGEFRPLRLVDAVEQNNVRTSVPLRPAHRVFSAETSAQVREMMILGAREGTGKKVNCTDIVMGTKTGTAQKVVGEVCLHVELQHNREHGCHGARACRRKLAGQRVHKGSCYTSSMCAWGHLPDSEREVMVLVVVDEPRSSKKFGGDVAGPAAVGILKEALGLTRGGESAIAASAAEFSTLETTAANASEHPWAEVEHATR